MGAILGIIRQCHNVDYIYTNGHDDRIYPDANGNCLRLIPIILNLVLETLLIPECQLFGIRTATLSMHYPTVILFISL